MIAARSTGLIRTVAAVIAVGLALTAVAEEKPTRKLLGAKELPSEDFLGKALAFVITVQVELPAPVGRRAQMNSPAPLNLNQTPSVSGTGFIVAATENRGLALVPAHLAISGKRITATLSDGRTVNASFYALDEVTNLALIQISAEKLQAARWADSDKLTASSWAAVFSVDSVLVGTLDGTPRVGATARDQAYRYVPIHQFFGLTSNGFIGSPVLNQSGEVIGVLSSLRPNLGLNSVTRLDGPIRTVPANIGYALPSNYVRRIADDLRDFRSVRHPWVGVTFVNAPAGGAQVIQVVPGGPFHAAGIMINDVVVAINGQPVTNGVDLAVLLSKSGPDSRAVFRVKRGNSLLERAVEIKAKPIDEN